MRNESTPPEPSGRKNAPDPRADAELVSLVIEDPRRGLAALYNRFAVDVNRLVWRLLGPDSDREDIVQQVFLQLIQSIGSLRSPERLHFWVRSITINVVRSELRKRMVRRAFLRKQPVEEPLGDLLLDMESQEFVARSAALLNRLPSKERIVFLLYYLEELTLPEIADICGFSSMTAKRRLSAARLRFRKLARRDATFEEFFDEKEMLS